MSVFGSGGKKVLIYIRMYYLECNTVAVVFYFFWFWRELVFGVTYVLSVQYSCTGKKVVVVCLVGARSLLRPEEKKVLVVCLAGA